MAQKKCTFVIFWVITIKCLGGVSSILELAEANSLIPPVPEPDIFFGLRTTLTDVDVNRLHFPGHNGEYSFNMNDLNFMGVIESM